MSLSPTIELTELLAFIFGIVGIVFSGIMVVTIEGDRRNIKRAGKNGVNKRMTNADMRNELSRTYKLACFVVLSGLAMTIPPSTQSANQFVGEMFRWMLLSWEAVAVFNSYTAWRDRKENIEDLEKLYKGSTKEA